MKKAVIFDMDGVLVDNSEIHIDSFIAFCSKYDIPFTRQQIYPLFGKGNDEILPAIFGRELSQEEIRQLSQEKEEMYRALIEKTIQPMPGLVDLLEELKAAGIKTAVGSSGMRKNVDFVLEKCGIASYFDAIADGDQVKKAKPAPDIFLLAAKKLEVSSHECIVFEDSFAGIEAARRAGMAVIAVTTTFPKEQHTDYDAIIADFTQINTEILKNM